MSVASGEGHASAPPLYSKDVEKMTDYERAVVAVGNKLAISGKVPVFGMVHKETGRVDEFDVSRVKHHDFVWTAWEDFSGAKLEGEGKEARVPAAFINSVAATLEMIREVLPERNDAGYLWYGNHVLQLAVPAEVLPTGDAEKAAFRHEFLRLVREFSFRQRVWILLHGLEKRADGTDEFELVKAGALKSEYLLPAPRGDAGTDLIASAEAFLAKSAAGELNTAGAADLDNPRVVTLVAGHGWHRAGGAAALENKEDIASAEQRFARLAPLFGLVASFDTNVELRAKVAQSLVQ